MASTVTKSPQLITAINTAATKTNLLDLVESTGRSGATAFIKVRSGTFYFCVGEAPNTSISPSYTSSDENLMMEFGTSHNGDGDIWYSAAASSTSFAISWG